jgi:hypothetical protein
MSTARVEAEKPLTRQIDEALNQLPLRPWCIHGLLVETFEGSGPGERDRLLQEIERAAEQLVRDGRARHEAVSAVSIGVHCEDSMFWSTKSPKSALEAFGPEYESPTILRRLASHMYCRGL